MKKLYCAFFTLLFTTLAFSQNNSPLIPYRDGKLWGFCDTLGNVKVKPLYKEIKDFNINSGENMVSRYVVKTNQKYFVIDQNRKVLLPELNAYDSIYLNKYHENHFWVYKKGKVGLFFKNKEVLPCLYDAISVSYNGSYEVRNGKLCGLVNSLGKLIIPIEYLDIYKSWDDEDETNSKFVWVAKGLLVKKKFYDVIIEKNDDLSSSSLVGKAVEVMEADETISTDLYNGKIAKMEAKYDEIAQVNKYSHYAIVISKGKKGVYSLETEKEVVATKYDEVEFFNYDKGKKVFLVKLNQKYGLVKEGNISILECDYDKIEENEKHRVILISKNNKFGCVIFNTIYPPIQPKYKSIKSVDGIPISNSWQFGLFEVETETGKGYVGENGVEFFKN